MRMQVHMHVCKHTTLAACGLKHLGEDRLSVCMHNLVNRRKTYNAHRTFKRVIGEAALQGNFVRLADYILVEALAAHVTATAEGLAAQLAAPRQDASLKARACTHQRLLRRPRLCIRNSPAWLKGNK